MKGALPMGSWQPSYPDRVEHEVRMVDCTMQTYVSDRRPVISIAERSLEDPACFWIDSEHIYARLNWREWCAIEPSTPNVAAAICTSHYCQMMHTLDNAIREMSAPVYHVEALPPDLFVRTSPNSSNEEASNGKQKAIEALDEAIPVAVDALGFKNVALEGDTVDLVVSGDDLAVLFAVYPEDEEYSACPGDADMDSTGDDTHCIPKTVLDDLNRYRAGLRRLDSHAKLLLAIIASSKTLESMRCHWGDELAEKGIELVEYDGYENFLMEHFPLLD